ncbi:alanine racemase [cf. Phormidesmis sp. LEGE 11477]|uniref:alanine racemase n=1 Tax=cf. Phormidesmis sp. LEGE 11477 TaxID=1828680 RepID=UPI00187EF466|nr:alanine racemase [cf. Phormidesmis sp. LEGE 11477]MBE9061839.1 alanine racemase [cf. Phormidesmis sp. LEGE 11477]
MLSWEATPALSPMRCARAWVEINLTALAHNVRSLKALLPEGTDLLSVVKADAYGHGAVMVADVAIAAGTTWLGVATVPEGIELRQAGIEVPILVMGAVNDPAEVRAIAHWNLQPIIVNPKQALVFSETLKGQGTRLPVHIQLDTGMSRLGFSWQQAVEFVRFVQQLPYLETVGLCSHLATADSPDQSVMQLQHERFECAITSLKQENLLPARLHIANSAAALVDPALHYDMVRVGLATYGLYPAPHLRTQPKIALQPVLEVKARITHIKEIDAHTGVSYSYKFIAPRPMKIAIVGIGYADGVPRILSNKMQVILHEQRVNQIGAITMDQLIIDVSDLKSVQEGDIVTLLGKTQHHCLRADDWADLADTISWEILCGFKHRLPRITLSNQSAPQITSKYR